jgi:uncharacterized protein with ParB-like and HNH nuclease domain
MEFEITTWTIGKLHTLFKTQKLNLSPPYQRNFIWSTDDQQTLIDSIVRNVPIPNFFVLELKDKTFEMVDGQQRSRTIINFIDGYLTDPNGDKYTATLHPKFKSFEFPVTIINDIADESIEKFYALVNKTGIHLNKPEVRKADYFETNLLKLVEELTNSKKLLSLKLFTDSSLKRMNDKEFISELLVLMKDGHVDKKGAIDQYYEEDITLEESNKLKRTFNGIIEKISLLNSVYPIQKTRYKQRNDFYTLFDFVKRYKPYDEEELIYFYKILVLIGGDIKPTQDDCEPLKEYARNCVTQSNSKLARQHRLKFFQQLLLGEKPKPNPVQKDIIKFYDITARAVKIETYYSLDLSEMPESENIEFLR